MKPIVAIIGRPNVGKSTLFNRIVVDRAAIVERESGVTRDRIYADAEWLGRQFIIVDTGGLGSESDDFATLIEEQAKAAVQEADAIIMLVDARAGLLPGDQEVADLLRRSGKPVLVVANKAETERLRQTSQEFFALGLGDPIAISAAHGMGVGDMLDDVIAALPAQAEGEQDDAPARLPTFAVIGRPNVGKSSLVNALLGARRVITSEVPGTTRDTIRAEFEFEGQTIAVIDTAGLRRPSRVEPGLERFSAMRSLRAVQEADVVWLLIDVEQGISEQERRMAGYVAESGRGLVIVLNKIDLLDRPAGELSAAQDKVRQELYFVPWAPMVAVSALTGEHIARLVRAGLSIVQGRNRQIERGELTALVRDACLLRPPGTYRGRPIRYLGAEQLPGLPPAVAIYFDYPQVVASTYLRYIENRLREAYSFAGSPLRIVARSKAPRDRKPSPVEE